MTIPTGSERVEGSPELSGVHLLLALLRTRRIVIWGGGALVCLVLAVSLLSGRRYTSSLAILPQAEGGGAMAGLSSVAAQFGVDVGGSSPDQSPQFYDALIATAPFREALAASMVRVSTAFGGSAAGDSVFFPDWLEIDPDLPPRVRVTLAARQLRKMMRSVPSVHTSMLLVAVSTKDSLVSFDVAQRTLALINEFNVVRRNTDAGAERRFVEGRVREVQESLAVNEARVLGFLAQNRNYSSSPRLTLDLERLRRRVTFFEGVVGTLMQAEEQSRIQELRRTPVVTVVEQPMIAALPDSRKLVLKVLLAVLATVVVWTGVGVLWLSQTHPMLSRRDALAAVDAELAKLFAGSWWPRSVRSHASGLGGAE